MNFDGETLRVAANVLAIALKYRTLTGVPPLAELAVTYQESGWRENATNPSDPGGSYGPWQINGQAHQPDSQVAEDPWYDYGFPAVKDAHALAWTDAFAQAWQDPNQRQTVLQGFAPAAQGSIQWTPEQAQSAYQAALTMLELLS